MSDCLYCKNCVMRLTKHESFSDFIIFGVIIALPKRTFQRVKTVEVLLYWI